MEDEAEASKIVEWLKREINAAWENRHAITPRYQGMPRPQMIRILRCLPKTNCRACGEPTCMVFATRVAEGIKGSTDCPPLTVAARQALDAYMAGSTQASFPSARASRRLYFGQSSISFNSLSL